MEKLQRTLEEESFNILEDFWRVEWSGGGVQSAFLLMDFELSFYFTN